MRKINLGRLLAALIFVTATAGLSPVSNAEPITYQMNLAISESDLQAGTPIEVEAKLRLPEAKSEICLYLAYNDPLFYYDPTQELGALQNLGELSLPRHGSIRLVDQTKATISMHHELPQLYRLTTSDSSREIDLSFEFIIPRWPDRLGNQFLVHQFYPQILEDCPPEDLRSFDWKIRRDVAYEARIKWPSNWQLTSPYEFEKTDVLVGKGALSFNLSRNYRIHTFEVRDTAVQMVYLSDQFQAYQHYIRNFLFSLQASFGKYPHGKLLVVETEDLERGRIPGVITLNRPKQAGMQAIQQGYLNWVAWQLAFLMSEQWIGTSVAPQSFNDYWFFRGTAEFAASIAIQHEPSIRNLFASEDLANPFLRLSYHQGADLAASILRQVEPDNRLIDPESLLSRHEFLHMNSFVYIRHVLAMRYLHWLYGESFMAAVRDFYSSYEGRRATHQDFLEHLAKQPGLVRQGFSAADLLQRWWGTNSWPNYRLGRIRINDLANQNQSRKLEVEVKQLSPLRLPYDILLTTRRGRLIRETVYSDDPSTVVSFDLLAQEKIDLIEINPGREIFDRDRFDNSNRGPRFRFFPGNANTLSDDAYTVVWLPYPTLLPGESLSLNLGLQVFRYVSAGMSGVISYQIEENSLGYQLRYLTELNNPRAQVLFSLVENFGQTYKGDRVAGLTLSRTPLFLTTGPEISVGLGLNFRETLGDSESRHLVSTWRLGLGNRRAEHCSFLLFGERQQTIGAISQIDYLRDAGALQLGCQGRGMELRLRGFLGRLQEFGDASSSASVAFRPQSLDEARIRIDRPSLESSQEIQTLSVDMSWPAHLPIPSRFFVLPRQSKWRLSYDYGEAKRPDNIYSNLGFGFTLPMGGDVVGRASLSFLNFTVMGIFYRRYDDQISYQPGVMFDFMGTL